LSVPHANAFGRKRPKVEGIEPLWQKPGTFSAFEQTGAMND